jgi:hypothetical protein
VTLTCQWVGLCVDPAAVPVVIVMRGEEKGFAVCERHARALEWAAFTDPDLTYYLAIRVISG